MLSTKTLEVGAEVEAYCTKCKALTVHIIEGIKGEKITKVMCKSCLSTHKYKSAADMAEKEAKKSTTRKKAAPKEKVKVSKESRKWSRVLAKLDSDNPIEYSMAASYSEQDVIHHSTFGVGVVVKVIDPERMDVIFQDGLKKLVQNRD